MESNMCAHGIIKPRTQLLSHVVILGDNNVKTCLLIFIFRKT